jgi:hypothetical protein
MQLAGRQLAPEGDVRGARNRLPIGIDNEPHANTPNNSNAANLELHEGHPRPRPSSLGKVQEDLSTAYTTQQSLHAADQPPTRHVTLSAPSALDHVAAPDGGMEVLGVHR